LEVEEKVKKDVWRNRMLSPHVYAIAKCSLGFGDDRRRIDAVGAAHRGSSGDSV
jgi:hypothetical protein